MILFLQSTVVIFNSVVLFRKSTICFGAWCCSFYLTSVLSYLCLYIPPFNDNWYEDVPAGYRQCIIIGGISYVVGVGSRGSLDCAIFPRTRGSSFVHPRFKWHSFWNNTTCSHSILHEKHKTHPIQHNIPTNPHIIVDLLEERKQLKRIEREDQSTRKTLTIPKHKQ